jgi:cbb3-type cytochrome oxidase subunit 3
MLFGLTIAPIITVVVGFIMQFATPALFLVLVVLQYIIYFLNNKK